MHNRIKKRETFYLAGYDPRGARHYYNLYKKEASLQSKVNGMTMDISSRKRNETHIQSWEIRSTSKNMQTHTQYHCLEWDDIIRKHWKKSFFTLFMDLFYILKMYVASGIIFKYAKVAPTQMIAAFYPVVFLFTSLILAGYVSNMLYGFIVPYTYLPLAVLLSLAVAYAILEFSLYIGNKMAVFWLLRIYVFSLKYVDEELEEIDHRIDMFAKYIANVIKKSQQNDTDEILIVSHSVGTIMIIPIISKVLDTLELSEEALGKISIMTLGECIPIVSFLPKAVKYRESMKNILRYKGFFWVDYTASIDGACFPLMDYYKQSAVEREDKPLYLSPRFHTLFYKKRYATLRKNKYLTHFLYLMSTDISGKYDFFKMTAGHKSLKNHIKKGM